MSSQSAAYRSALAESVQDMGERLRIIRLQQGMELDAIFQKTRVSVKYLTAIESGDLEALPELVYIRGFIRRYAEALNQDAAAFNLDSAPAVMPLPLTERISNYRPDIGRLVKRLQYPLYGLMVIAAGSIMVYLNNQEFSPAPTQSSVEVPVVSRPESDL